MNDGYYRKINLAGLSVETFTDNSFVNIRDFLDKFSDDNPDQSENQELKILFGKGNRKIELSRVDGILYLSLVMILTTYITHLI